MLGMLYLLTCSELLDVKDILIQYEAMGGRLSFQKVSHIFQNSRCDRKLIE